MNCKPGCFQNWFDLFSFVFMAILIFIAFRFLWSVL